MDRVKLAELRKKKSDRKASEHNELLEASSSVKDAIIKLHETINANKPFEAQLIVDELKDLKASVSFKEDVERLEKAITETELKVKDIDTLIDSVKEIKNEEVVESVNRLIAKLEENSISQDPKDFQPVRRVRKVGNRLIFDDDPLQVIVNGGGGGGSAIPRNMIVESTDFPGVFGLVVLNPDGSMLSVGGGGGTPDAATFDLMDGTDFLFMGGSGFDFMDA